jgi:hypothetical protein
VLQPFGREVDALHAAHQWAATSTGYQPDDSLLRENASCRDRLVWSMDGGTVV